MSLLIPFANNKYNINVTCRTREIRKLQNNTSKQYEIENII